MREIRKASQLLWLVNLPPQGGAVANQAEVIKSRGYLTQVFLNWLPVNGGYRSSRCTCISK